MSWMDEWPMSKETNKRLGESIYGKSIKTDMSNFKKITELPQLKFTGECVDNCFHVQDIGTERMSAVPLKSIFDEIVRVAKEQGCTVELKGESIAIIKGA